jgi:hypothetical protein
VQITNTGPLTDTTVVFSDTLPAQVSFGQWLIQPAGAVRNGSCLDWSGSLAPGHS